MDLSDTIPAATLVVMAERDGGPPDLLMVTRAARMAFAAGAVVFPGGRVDDGDRALAAADGHPDDAGKVTAIRETLEESGVAVALGIDDPALGLALQDALLAGADFAAMLADHGLAIDYAALTPFTRWVPGIPQPRRFDTVFYLVAAPMGPRPVPRPQPGECIAADWTSAADQLARIEAGDAHAIFPTKRNLERLARFDTLAAARADADRHGLDIVMPWVETVDGVRMVRIGENIGYPVVMEPLETAFRG